jgi:hypothetical protein
LEFVLNYSRKGINFIKELVFSSFFITLSCVWVYD